MQLAIGDVLEGKVTGITKFGAFVELEPGMCGLSRFDSGIIICCNKTYLSAGWIHAVDTAE